MDKEEIEDLIRRCFEADNNGEINFLSFWSGQHLIALSKTPNSECLCL